jgi:mycofactocin precursor
MSEIPATIEPKTELPTTVEAIDDRESPEDELVLEDLLVENISIDGMCGIY